MVETVTRAAGAATEAAHRAHERGADWLSGAGLRPTRQRLSLAALLIGDGKNRHVTAESLYDAARAAGEKVSLATVYNTLRAFCRAGLMNEITVDGTKSHFDTRTDDHPHFYWEDENRLSDAPADNLRIEGLPEAPDGTVVSHVDVVIRLRKA
ncbi:iron response transcriptional regulator IrrA [Acidimangrovimonas sediminis]|uniref:iron response transcriptional regulator IrrA n=1 Tax=Acidimangrovimonas sediminis TaxID=2056283 RepID=UPI001E647307|nr:transcriptional repressor [Acidimangrovimonas sediminis]